MRKAGRGPLVRLPATALCVASGPLIVARPMTRPPFWATRAVAALADPFLRFALPVRSRTDIFLLTTMTQSSESIGIFGGIPSAGLQARRRHKLGRP